MTLDPWLYFWVFLKASLLSSGGTGNLPILHAELTAAGVARESQFTEALMIGQLAPGPNGLWSVSLGYLTRGWLGGLLALLAVTSPPLLILVVEAIYRRVATHPAVDGFARGLSLAIVGVSIVVLVRIFPGHGRDMASLAIAFAAACAGAARRIPTIAVIAAAAVIGMAVYGR